MSVRPRQHTDDLSLLIGRNVEVRRMGQVIDKGRFEDMTEDGLIIWLAMNGSQSRRLIEIDHRHEVLAITDEETAVGTAGS